MFSRALLNCCHCDIEKTCISRFAEQSPVQEDISLYFELLPMQTKNVIHRRMRSIDQDKIHVRTSLEHWSNASDTQMHLQMQIYPMY